MIMQIKTSYFYQIRNFTPNLIPVSICITDPDWYRPPRGKEYYIDKRGIICGLRYEPLIVQKNIIYNCPCENKQLLQGQCDFMKQYKDLLNTVNFEKVIKAFNYCIKLFSLPFDDKETVIVLMLYETPNNPCSERLIIQEYFNNHGIECKELEYPI